MSASPLPRAVDGFVASTPMVTCKGLLFCHVCSPFTPLYRSGQVGVVAWQLTLSPFYGLEVRAVTAVIRLVRRSWTCRPFLG